jgi:hypothetical protein
MATDYEKLRNENILRNEEFLKLLGLEEIKSNIPKQDSIAPSKKSRNVKRSRDTVYLHDDSTVNDLPIRRSGRLNKDAANADEEIPDLDLDEVGKAKE